jgi:dTDP-glucose pyrophosphorylase/CBS domain-containing protein
MPILKPLDSIDEICLPPDAMLRQAIECIDHGHRGIALITDPDRHLVGTVTDGDIRRAMLRGKTFTSPIHELLEEKKQQSTYATPVTALIGTESLVLQKLMHDLVIRQIPIVDAEDRVASIVTIEDLVPDDGLPLQAVIMAGGAGSRLMPLTEHTPKPLLPVGDTPIMELIIAQLRSSGIHRVNVTTHYHREKIKSHFRDGQHLGVELTYVDEESPLGTAGALSLLAAPTEPLLVINGDILTQVDFRAMLQFHREHKADMTVAVRRYEFEVPYGVVECNDVQILKLTEKPSYGFFVNAGIYLLEPSVHEHIPSREAFNMTDLIQRLLDKGRPIVSFPVREYWLDIGRHSDYQLAQEHARERNGR